MKRFLCFVLAVTLVMGLAACSSNPATNTDTTKNDSTGNTSSSGKPTEGTTDVPPEQNEVKTLQVPTKQIYFDCPGDWVARKATYSTILLQTDECLVTVSYNWFSPYEGDLTGIVDFISGGVLREVSSYGKGSVGASTINVTSKENTKIAGVDAVKFTGIVPNTEWDCHVYGYTMIFNDVPMMVMGLVSTMAQDAAMIAEIDALTDQVAASLRTEK